MALGHLGTQRGEPGLCPHCLSHRGGDKAGEALQRQEGMGLPVTAWAD